MTEYRIFYNEDVDFSIRDEWNTLVKEANYGTFFHSYEWFQILKKFGKNLQFFSPRILMVKDESKKNLVGLLWLFLDNRGVANSPRFGDYGGPLFSSHLTGNQKITVLKILLRRIDEMREQTRKIFLRIPRDFFHDVFRQNRYRVNPINFTFLLSVNRGLDYVRSQFRRDAKRGIKSAIKNGVTTEIITEKNQLKKYYVLYTSTMRKLDATTRNYIFFELIWDLLHHQKRLRVQLARYQNEYVAGIMTFSWNDVVHIFGNVSTPQSLRVHPNDLLYSDTIKWAVETGYNVVDFGLAPLNKKAGLYQFKKRWGGHPELLYSASKTFGVRNILSQIFHSIKK
jgi:hypothetical protein